MTKIKAKAISYMRFSSAQQSDGFSFDRQEDVAQMFAEMNDLELDEEMIFRDQATSAFRGKNKLSGNLRILISLAKDGHIEPDTVLIIEALDRLSRDKLSKSYELVKEILDAGLRIGIATTGKIYNRESLDNLGENTELFNSFNLANMESEYKSRRSKKNWEKKRKLAQEGKAKLTGKCPGWLTLNKKTDEFEIIEKRQKIVNQMFDWAIEGLGKRNIASNLNASGEKTWWKKKNWTSSTVSVILSNPAVYGRFHPEIVQMTHVVNPETGEDDIVKRTRKDGKAIDGYFPAIMSRAKFNKAQRAIKSRISGSPGRRTKKFRNLLTRVAKCGECGGNMHFKGSHTRDFVRDYLRCYNAEHKNTDDKGKLVCTNIKLHHYKPIEERALESLTSDHMRRAIGQKKSELEELENQKNDLEQKRIDLSNDIDGLRKEVKLILGISIVDLPEDHEDRISFHTIYNKREEVISNLDELKENILYVRDNFKEIEKINKQEFHKFIDEIEGLPEDEAYIQRAKINHYLRQAFQGIYVDAESKVLPVYVDGIPEEQIREAQKSTSTNTINYGNFATVKEAKDHIEKYKGQIIPIGYSLPVDNVADYISLIRSVNHHYPSNDFKMPYEECEGQTFAFDEHGLFQAEEEN